MTPRGREGNPPAPAPPADLEEAIDALYRLPLAEFTAARNALARTLPRAEAARVKALAKPTVVPWLANQVYWQARSVYDRLLDAGAALRRAQVSALEKPGASPSRVQQVRDKVRDATDAHRQALADATHQALRVAAQHALSPPADALTRMLEALSLSSAPPAHPGRLTEVVQPAGFEALFGISLSPAGRGSPPPARAAAGPAQPAPVLPHVRRRDDEDAARARRAAFERARQAAQDAVAATRQAEQAARQQERASDRAVRDAEAALTRARRDRDEAVAALERATQARSDAEARWRALASRAHE